MPGYDTSEIEQLILSFLPRETGMQKTVIRAMNEAVRCGGKRVRPVLMYEMCRSFAEACGKKPEVYTPDIGPFLAAVEMIHTFSLIHDDLPCMDNDTLRRGKPTTWVTYGEDMATLAGDALALEAFCAAAEGSAETASDPVRALKAVCVLAKKSGVAGMLGGQAVDVEQTGNALTGDQVDFIDRKKTGSLIEASLMIGAIIGGASDPEIGIVEKIGTDIGMAFQIQDDILDETSTPEELGKNVHEDQKNSKTTYVTLYGMEEAKRKAAELIADAGKLLHTLPGNTKTLDSVIAGLLDRKK